MELIPAIDLQRGEVVRLRQGAFDDATVYGGDPLAVAQRWVEQGATRLHLVDLDAARTGAESQAPLIRSIVEAAAVPCQVAGGLRDAERASAMVAAGADRVVLGTALLRDPALAARLVEEHGAASVVAALDVRGDQAVGEGWRSGAPGMSVLEATRALHEHGIRLFAVTAIARDGLLGGPDLDLLDSLAAEVGPDGVIASGGITTTRDVAALASRGFGGAILGRALYEGMLTLAEALEAAASTR
jgi:phosphoribosylformimino-5-aminoimidazole carboxamide ribotide isomerase